MIVRSVTSRPAFAFPLLLAMIVATHAAHADRAAAQDCAAKLPNDARAIFDKTLPQIKPGTDLRALVTSNTRSLAFAGTIDRGTARDSAVAAAQCLERAGS